ncbi:MAG TPA: hypothetical protein VG817_00655 [Gemmatimonadales bacterium]|nr:hypothetical protein [Gemmatimonadales bacterium]
MTDIDCGVLQDRMPDVASGAAVWTEVEAAHLAGCDSCAREWRIVRAARRLGGSAARRVNSEVLAANVIAGVRRQQKRSLWVRVGWVSGLAAAAILVTVLRVPPPRSSLAQLGATGRAAEPPVVASALPLAELDALDSDQLEAVLEQLDATAGSFDGGLEARIGDLDDQQLESVLRSLEG